MKLLTSLLRRCRSLVILAVSLALFSQSSVRVHAQDGYVEFGALFEGDAYGVFGANDSVVISGNAGVFDNCQNPFDPAVNVYVVNVSTLSDGAALTDVNGSPNVVFTFDGNYFDSETIAFTAPGGNLGNGVYGIVFDKCQDGHFNAGVDSIFYPAFEVDIPANVPNLPNAQIAALKGAADSERAQWQAMATTIDT